MIYFINAQLTIVWLRGDDYRIDAWFVATTNTNYKIILLLEKIYCVSVK